MFNIINYKIINIELNTNYIKSENIYIIFNVFTLFIEIQVLLNYKKLLWITFSQKCKEFLNFGLKQPLFLEFLS